MSPCVPMVQCWCPRAHAARASAPLRAAPCLPPAPARETLLALATCSPSSPECPAHKLTPALTWAVSHCVTLCHIVSPWSQSIMSRGAGAAEWEPGPETEPWAAGLWSVTSDTISQAGGQWRDQPPVSLPHPPRLGLGPTKQLTFKSYNRVAPVKTTWHGWNRSGSKSNSN